MTALSTTRVTVDKANAMKVCELQATASKLTKLQASDWFFLPPGSHNQPTRAADLKLTAREAERH